MRFEKKIPVAFSRAEIDQRRLLEHRSDASSFSTLNPYGEFVDVKEGA